jgi:hypothetical protein
VNDIRDDVAGTLRFTGYREIRVRGGEWRPIADLNGELGTTGETEIIDRKGAPTCRLVDADTGETVGRARLSCPVDPGR